MLELEKISEASFDNFKINCWVVPAVKEFFESKNIDLKSLHEYELLGVEESHLIGLSNTELGKEINIFYTSVKTDKDEIGEELLDEKNVIAESEFIIENEEENFILKYVMASSRLK